MFPTFIAASSLMRGDIFVRAYDGVNGKPSTLALIEVQDVGERAGGYVSVTGIRTVPENSSSSANVKTPPRSYLLPETMMVLVLFHELTHVPSCLVETTHKVRLRKGVYLGRIEDGKPNPKKPPEASSKDAMHFTETRARMLALLYEGRATKVKKP